MFFKPLILALSVVSVAACHGGHRDPSKMITRVSERIESKLELREDQKPAFNAIVEKVKVQALARQQKGREGLLQVKQELDKEQVNIDKIAGLAKERARDRFTEAEIDAFIDELTVFYKSLDAKQQKTLAGMAKDKLDWID